MKVDPKDPNKVAEMKTGQQAAAAQNITKLHNAEVIKNTMQMKTPLSVIFAAPMTPMSLMSLLKMNTTGFTKA